MKKSRKALEIKAAVYAERADNAFTLYLVCYHRHGPDAVCTKYRRAFYDAVRRIQVGLDIELA